MYMYITNCKKMIKQHLFYMHVCTYMVVMIFQHSSVAIYKQLSYYIHDYMYYTCIQYLHNYFPVEEASLISNQKARELIGHFLFFIM